MLLLLQKFTSAKRLPALYIFLFLTLHAFAQQNRSTDYSRMMTYYKSGIQYKDGIGVKTDYAKAFHYFSQAADLGDAQSIYAVAYMHFKGLGCSQDYLQAASLFSSGAFQGRPNSMYFYALCLRNGYGLNRNEDSALYWLKKADSSGYRQAKQELAMKKGENGDEAAKKLVQQIENAAIPDQLPPNHFKKLEQNNLSPAAVTGQYHGYLIQYDWSGQNVVSAKGLELNLREDKDKLAESWQEENSDSFPLTASLLSKSLTFINTSYKRRDHYSPDKDVAYRFEDASLNVTQKGNVLYLAGTVSMFSPDRNEPSKPLFIALSRTADIKLPDVTSIAVSPNPFTSVLTVDFELSTASFVQVQLLTTEGKMVYKNSGGLLQPGHYLLPLQPGSLTSGTYILKLIYGNQSATLKVIKN